MRWIHLRLRAPFAAFGGEAIDAHGITRDFPSQSMLTGLIANALGWHRRLRDEHHRLQTRVVYGAVRETEPVLGRTTDYQTAQLAKEDRAWTTRGIPAQRDGGPATYVGAHQRWRDYHADLRMSVVLRLDPADEAPTLDDLEAAFLRPARPLFIGRKSCLPAARSSTVGSRRKTFAPRFVPSFPTATKRSVRSGRRPKERPMPIALST